MKKRKLILTALAASMLFPTSLAPVSAADFEEVTPRAGSQTSTAPNPNEEKALPKVKAYGFRKVGESTLKPNAKWKYSDGTESEFSIGGKGDCNHETIWLKFSDKLPEGSQYWITADVKRKGDDVTDNWGIYGGDGLSCMMSLRTWHQWEKKPTQERVNSLVDGNNLYDDGTGKPDKENLVLTQYLQDKEASIALKVYVADAKTVEENANGISDPKNLPVILDTSFTVGGSGANAIDNYLSRDVINSVPANLTAYDGGAAPGYGHVGTYTTDLNTDNPEEKVITLTAKNLTETINSQGTVSYWVGVGLLKRDGVKYSYGIEGEERDAKLIDRFQEAEGAKYTTLYWGSSNWKEDSKKTGFIKVTDAATGALVDSYKVKFDISPEESERLRVNKVDSQTTLFDKQPEALGTIAVQTDEETKTVKVTGDAKQIDDWTAGYGNDHDKNSGHFVALHLESGLSQDDGRVEIRVERADGKEVTLNDGNHIVRIENYETKDKKVKVNLYAKNANKDPISADAQPFDTYTIDLSGVNCLKATEEIIPVTKPSEPDYSSVKPSDDDKNIIAKTEIDDIQADEDVAKAIDEVLNDPNVSSSSTAVKVFLIPTTKVTPTKIENNKYIVTVSYSIDVVAIETSQKNYEDVPKDAQVLAEASVDLGKLSEPITITIGIPKETGLQPNNTVYVYHAGDEHDGFVGSSHLVTIDRDNKVSFKIDHLSSFEVSLAKAAEIKTYTVDGKETKSATSDGDMAVPTGKTVTLDVPEGITLTTPDGVVTGPKTHTFTLANEGDMYPVTADPTAAGAGVGLKSTNYRFKAEGKTVTENPPTISGPAGKPTVKTQTMYRVYNKNNGEHFFTANKAEKDYLVSLGWKDEGTAWNAPATSDTPVFRVYNKNSGEHFYTTNAEEKAHLVSVGWQDEGIGWYSDEKKGVAVHRLFNPNAKDAGSHHYTVSESERDYLAGIGWRKENVGWYGVK